MITELMPETHPATGFMGELDCEKRERAWTTMDKLNAVSPTATASLQRDCATRKFAYR